MDINKVVDGIVKSNHKGCEKLLQDNVSKSLAAKDQLNEFTKMTSGSFGGKINNNEQLWGKKCYGKELGFVQTGGSSAINRYVDIALAKLGGSDNINPDNIQQLLEIKIFNPKKIPVKGRYYPWIYQYNCFPPQYDFIKINRGVSRITNADEGQIFFDLIKMLNCKETCCPSTEPEIYQLIAIKEVNTYKISFDYAVQSLQRMFEVFNENIKNLEIFDYASFPLSSMIKCSKCYEIEGTLIWKPNNPCAKSPTLHGYHHIFIRWDYKEVSSCMGSRVKIVNP